MLRLALAARKLRRQLLVGVVIQLSMQLSGIDAIFYYSTRAFRAAGLDDPQLATTALGCLNVLLTVVSISLMDRFGRRTLLLAAWAGMAASYALLTVAFVGATAGAAAGAMHVLATLAMGGAVTSFAIGPGCIAWFIVAEVSSASRPMPRMRAHASGRG